MAYRFAQLSRVAWRRCALIAPNMNTAIRRLKITTQQVYPLETAAASSMTDTAIIEDETPKWHAPAKIANVPGMPRRNPRATILIIYTGGTFGMKKALEYVAF